MKLKQTVTILFLIIGLYSYSQKEKTRIIDWQKLDKINRSGIKEPVKNGQFAIFKIININKFLFQVSVSGESIDLQTQMPDELKKLFRITEADKTAIKNNDNAESGVEDATKGVDIVKNMKKDTVPTPTFSQAKADILKATLKKLESNCDDYLLKIKKISSDIGNLKKAKIELINMANQDISYKEMVNRVNELPINTTISSDFDEIEELYNLLNTLYIKAKIDAVGSTEVNNVDEASKKIKASYDKIDDEISSDKFLTLYSQVIYLSDQLKIEKNFTIISPPIQMVDDLINFKISANPVSTNSLAPHNSKTEFSFDVPSSSGIEVDFSVGPTLSLGKGAKDELYYLEQSTTLGKSYLRQRNNNNDGLPGLAAMMHIYDRVASETAIGLLFGVGAGFQGINDVGLSFYLGGSVILGKKQKVMLNTGVSFLRVNRLKEGEFKVGNEYTTQDFDINNVVEKVYRPSLFISLSYSLTKRVTN